MNSIQNSLLLLLISILFVNCTPKATQVQRFHNPEEPINSILFLYGNIEDDILQLDKASYEKSLKGKFNDLENKGFRINLYEHLFSMLNPTLVYNYNSMFEDFKSYSYEEFQQKLEEKEIDHVLLVTQKERIILEENVIRRYQVHLMETRTGKPLWVSYGFQSGSLNGPKSLARGIKKDLEGENLIVLDSFR